MAMNAIVWFEIYVQDMKRAQKFYESVLQIKLEEMDVPDDVPDMEMLSFPGNMNSYGANGTLIKMDGAPSGGNSTLVYFACTDCAEEGSRVISSGGRIEREKTSLGEYGFMVLAADTEGNMFGLHSME